MPNKKSKTHRKAPKQKLINWNETVTVANEKITRRLVSVARTGTLASGVFIQKYNATHMVANAPEWGDLASLYVEFRILSVRVHLFTEPGSLTGAQSVVFGDDRSSSGTPPGNVFGVWQLANARVWGAAQESRRLPVHQTNALTTEDFLFRGTLAPTSAFSLVGGVFSTDITDSTTKIWEFVEYLVEFSGPQ